jgi:hypothetical protein
VYQKRIEEIPEHHEERIPSLVAPKKMENIPPFVVDANVLLIADVMIRNHVNPVNRKDPCCPKK